MNYQALPLIALWASVATAQTPGLSATEVYDRVLPSMCAVLSLTSSGDELGFGSGFVWQDDQVVTNRHVIAGASHVNLECNGEVVAASGIVGHSELVDLVILDVRLNHSNLIAPNHANVRPGETVFAMGNPLGLSNTITQGIVGGMRSFDGVQYLQISADINPGNSGGPIVDGNGKLIGVATMGIKEAQGLNFGLPIHYISSLTKSRISFAELPDSEGFYESDREAQEQKQSPFISSLAFRGVSLGSHCSELYNLQHDIEININKQRSHGYSGEMVARARLLGALVEVHYECRNGLFLRGSYIGIPEDKLDLVELGLGEKYGDYAGTVMGAGARGGGKYWRPEPDQYISMLGNQLDYVDRGLERALDRVEVLRSIRANEL